MPDLTSNSRNLLDAIFGRCATCMRRSLAGACMSWAILAIAWLTSPNGLLTAFIGLSALALTALWLAHVTAFAARASRKAARGEMTTEPQPELDVIGRRQALGLMWRAAGVGIAASVPLALWPSDARAFCGQCSTNSDCGVGWVCKDTSPVNSPDTC